MLARLSRAILLLSVAFGAAIQPSGAATMSNGIAAPFNATLSNDSASVPGALRIQFFWKIDCPQEFCFMAKSFDAVRDGQVVASSSSFQFPSSSTENVPISIVIPAASWKPGDCFAVRAVAPSDFPDTKGTVYSNLSNRVCAPSS
jgi:hypothetical protein